MSGQDHGVRSDRVGAVFVFGGARADDAEDKAVAFVEKLGGAVARDEKAPGKPVIGA